jgi:hypothetical protein
MKTIKERRLEILKWERENRTSQNRAINQELTCIYSGEIGCGVGRLIEDKDLCAKLDSSSDRCGGSGVCLPSVFEQLPENVQELGQEFLMDLQALHDHGQHWTSNGLSNAGENFMNELEVKWS